MPITIPNIVKPFEEFKWRWMEFTPVESFNRPDILLGITRAINECEGAAASSDAFIGKLSVIQRDLLHGSGITLVPADRTRNVLRRQGRYWRGFGLLSNDSTRALRLTDFGQKYADGTYSNDDFVSSIIKNHTLPNIRIEKPEIVGLWQDANITIRPLELVLQILSVLDDTAPAGQNYITPHELAKVVVPLSIAWRQPSDFAEAVMLYRSNPNAFSLLPDCTPEANDRRMVREHLLFLYEYEVLERT